MVPVIGFIEGEFFRANVLETVTGLLTDADLNEMMTVIDTLYGFANTFTSASQVDERHSILSALDEYMAGLKERIGVSANAINVLYEDGIINTVQSIDRNRIEGVYDRMKSIQLISILFDVNIRLQLEIGNQLHEIYGNTKMPLKSEFYTVIFDVSKKFIPYWTDPLYCCNSTTSKEIKELDNLKCQFIEEFRGLFRSAGACIEELVIDEVIDSYCRRIPEKYIVNSDFSSTFFMQFNGEDAIMNAMYEGQEKFKARFMDYFMDYLKNSGEYREFKESYYYQQNYYEFLETFGFNGNVKSINLNRECITTGVGKRRFLKGPCEDVHLFEDSFIQIDGEYPRIRFFDGSGKEFRTVMRGSLVPTAMPGYFSCVSQLFISGKLLMKMSDLLEGDELPRIRYGHLILTRRRIAIISHFDTLKRIGNETDYMYFRRLNRYFYDKGLPKRFFVVTKRNFNTPVEVLQGFKPLYIDIRNPVLLKVLEKDIVEKNHFQNFYFEEYLSDDSTNATEYDIEINKREGELV